MASNFPLRAPIGLIAGILLAVLSIVPIFAGWQWLQPPVQRFYLGQYVVTYLSATPIGTVAAFFKGSKVHTYRVLVQNRRLMTVDDAGRSGPVSVHAVQGDRPAAFNSWLRMHVYRGRDVTSLLCAPIEFWCFASIAMLTLGTVLDFRRRKRAREGLQLRGGEMLTVDEFNRATKGDGFGLYVKD